MLPQNYGFWTAAYWPRIAVGNKVLLVVEG